jgi:hypothetical protein
VHPETNDEVFSTFNNFQSEVFFTMGGKSKYLLVCCSGTREICSTFFSALQSLFTSHIWTKIFDNKAIFCAKHHARNYWKNSPLQKMGSFSSALDAVAAKLLLKLMALLLVSVPIPHKCVFPCTLQ